MAARVCLFQTMSLDKENFIKYRRIDFVYIRSCESPFCLFIRPTEGLAALFMITCT